MLAESSPCTYSKKHSQRSRDSVSRGRAARIENLSDREMHVFHLLGSGLGPKKMAHALNLSVKTIETHRENIKHKLGLDSGEALVERATEGCGGHSCARGRKSNLDSR